MLMLPFSTLWRAPYPYTVLLIFLITRQQCEDGEHAWGFLLEIRRFQLTAPHVGLI